MRGSKGDFGPYIVQLIHAQLKEKFVKTAKEGILGESSSPQLHHARETRRCTGLAFVLVWCHKSVQACLHLMCYQVRQSGSGQLNTLQAVAASSGVNISRRMALEVQPQVNGNSSIDHRDSRARGTNLATSWGDLAEKVDLLADISKITVVLNI